MKKKVSIFNFVVLLLTIFTFMNCSIDSDSSQVNSSSQKQTDVQMQSYFDKSTETTYLVNPNRELISSNNDSSRSTYNEVEIVVWHSWSNNAQHNTNIITSVGEDYVCIGGGAYANFGGGYGALLTESRPLDDFSGWAASSKDHYKTNHHTLYVYAIGLRLHGVDKFTLKNQLKLYQSTSGVQAHPNGSVSVPYAYKLIGGGARVNWSGEGNLLVSSYPSGNRWYASGKDHLKSSPASITTYAIGINQNIPGWGFLDIQQQTKTGSYVNNGVASSSLTTSYPWLLACPGAKSTFSSYGRMLFGIVPSSTSVTAYSKDHIKRDRGNVTAYAVLLKKR